MVTNRQAYKGHNFSLFMYELFGKNYHEIVPYLEKQMFAVSHRDRVLTVANSISEPRTLDEVLAAKSNFPFVQPTTSESLSILNYDPIKSGFSSTNCSNGLSGRRILKILRRYHDLSFYLGRVVVAPDGVYVNTQITDVSELEKLRGKAQKEYGGIWLLNNRTVKDVKDFGFAPFETFRHAINPVCYTVFAKSGLARVLEYTKQTIAKSFENVANPKLFPRGVAFNCPSEWQNAPEARICRLRVIPDDTQLDFGLLIDLAHDSHVPSISAGHIIDDEGQKPERIFITEVLAHYSHFS